MPGPLPVFTVVFYGSKNGVVDILPSGELYPGSFVMPPYHWDLTGYQNPPSGGAGGTYVRYALIYYNDTIICVTNPVTVVLQ